MRRPGCPASCSGWPTPARPTAPSAPRGTDHLPGLGSNYPSSARHTTRSILLSEGLLASCMKLCTTLTPLTTGPNTHCLHFLPPGAPPCRLWPALHSRAPATPTPPPALLFYHGAAHQVWPVLHHAHHAQQPPRWPRRCRDRRHGRPHRRTSRQRSRPRRQPRSKPSCPPAPATAAAARPGGRHCRSHRGRRGGRRRRKPCRACCGRSSAGRSLCGGSGGAAKRQQRQVQRRCRRPSYRAAPRVPALAGAAALAHRLQSQLPISSGLALR